MNTRTPIPQLPRRLSIATAIAATLLLGHCLLWLTRPSLNPYADGHLSLLSQTLSLTGFTALLTALSLVGAVCAGIAALVPRRTSAARVAAPLVTAGMLTAIAGLAGLSMAGYLVALTFPFAAVGVAVVAMIRLPRSRAVLGALLAAAAVVAVIFRAPLLAGMASAATAMVESAWALWTVTLTFTTTGLWMACAALAARSSTLIRAATATVVRWRVPITVLAALGPVPYALVRISWLTPWPIGAHPSSEPFITAWGMLLSLGAWLGAVLTIGLIRPWGERFPAWMPRIGGRTVPPLLAIGPGAAVAGLVCLAAIGWIALAEQLGIYFWILPLWFWGPMLALAVWGYAGHRAATDRDHELVGATPSGAKHHTEATVRMAS